MDNQQDTKIQRSKVATLRILALTVAWFAAIPYYLDPPPVATGGLLDQIVASTVYMFGVIPWLLRHPVHLALVLPAVFLFVVALVPPPTRV